MAYQRNSDFFLLNLKLMKPWCEKIIDHVVQGHFVGNENVESVIRLDRLKLTFIFVLSLRGGLLNKFENDCFYIFWRKMDVLNKVAK